MNNEMTNETLTNAIHEASHEMLRLAQTAMNNAYDNVIEMLSKKQNMYRNILEDHANVLQTAYGDRFNELWQQKQKVWKSYYMLQKIYGKVCEMRYNTSLKVKL